MKNTESVQRFGGEEQSFTSLGSLDRHLANAPGMVP